MSTDGHGAVPPPPAATAATAEVQTDDQTLLRYVWGRLRAWWPIVALSVAILAVAALTATLPDTGLPLDPDSTGPGGTRALVELLDVLDHPVEVVGPDRLGDADVVLLLDDNLDDGASDDLRRRVAAGGRLVVADPASDLTPSGTVPVGFLDRVLARACDVEALGDVETVRPGGGVVYEVPDSATGCFDTAEGSWLVIEPLGRGHIVSLGDAGVLTNRGLGDADNATLITQLLTPADGGGIAIVRPTVGGPDDAGLLDIIPTGIKVMLLQLLVAFGVFALWRARRLGPPLVDRAPVPLASAEQTNAVGALFARNTTRADASGRIARDTRRRLARGLGLHEAAATDEVARAVADRTGQDGAAIAAILEPDPPADDAELLRAAGRLANIERAVHSAVAPDPRGTVNVR